MTKFGKLGSCFVTVLALLTVSEGRHVWGPPATRRDCMAEPDLSNIFGKCRLTTSWEMLEQPLYLHGGLSAVDIDAALQSFCSEFERVQSCYEAETRVCIDKESIQAVIRRKGNICDPQTRYWIHAYLSRQGSDLILKYSCFAPIVGYIRQCNYNISESLEIATTLNPHETRLVEVFGMIQGIQDSALDCLYVLNPVEDFDDLECQRHTRGNILLFGAVFSAVMGPPGMALTISQLQNVQDLLPWG